MSFDIFDEPTTSAQSRPVPSYRAEPENDIRTTTRRPSFTDIAKEYAWQIGIQHSAPGDREIMWELARIMAEVKLMRPTAVLTVDGEEIEADVVCQVFDTLRGDQAAEVIRRYRENAQNVKRIRPYLRTLLYNSAFETFGQIERWAATEL